MKFIYVIAFILALFVALTADAAPSIRCRLQTWCQGHPWQCEDCTTCCDVGARVGYNPKCETTCKPVSPRRLR